MPKLCLLFNNKQYACIEIFPVDMHCSNLALQTPAVKREQIFWLIKQLVWDTDNTLHDPDQANWPREPHSVADARQMLAHYCGIFR